MIKFSCTVLLLSLLAGCSSTPKAKENSASRLPSSKARFSLTIAPDANSIEISQGNGNYVFRSGEDGVSLGAEKIHVSHASSSAVVSGTLPDGLYEIFVGLSDPGQPSSALFSIRDGELDSLKQNKSGSASGSYKIRRSD